MNAPCQGEKKKWHNTEGAILDAIQASWKRRKDLLLITTGSFLVLAGSMIPCTYDYWGDPRSFLNNPKVMAMLIGTVFFTLCVATGSVLAGSKGKAKGLALLLLILAIIYTLVGSVSIVAWTMAIIGKEVRFAPGLYIMYLGIIVLLVGSIKHFRRMRRPIEK